MTDDLWGDLPNVEGIKTPHALLLEQAQLLESKSNGLLVGRVSRVPSSDPQKLRSRFQILAPSLKYSFRVLETSSAMGLYPATVDIDPDGPTPVLRAKDENELKAVLRDVFRSERVQNVIAGLLAQLKADSN